MTKRKGRRRNIAFCQHSLLSALVIFSYSLAGSVGHFAELDVVSTSEFGDEGFREFGGGGAGGGKLGFQRVHQLHQHEVRNPPIAWTAANNVILVDAVLDFAVPFRTSADFVEVDPATNDPLYAVKIDVTDTPTKFLRLGVSLQE